MKTLKTEMNDLSSSELTVVRLSNMFTTENCEDRRFSSLETLFYRVYGGLKRRCGATGSGVWYSDRNCGE